jgi:hypothetical protein
MPRQNNSDRRINFCLQPPIPASLTEAFQWAARIQEAIRLCSRFARIIFTWRDHVTAAPIRQWT